MGHHRFRALASATIYASIASGVKGIPVLDNLFSSPTTTKAPRSSPASIILAIMITPIITSLSREVIATVPTTDKEGAYALEAPPAGR